jgi:uncharacterized membrane protein
MQTVENTTSATPPVPGSEPERAERVVEDTITLFRWGYIASFTLVGIGLIVALVRDIALATELGGPGKIVGDVLDLDPNGFIGLGIGVMILTPIIMTIEVAVNFFRAGDSKFGTITAIVAAILVVTLALAFV